jgi:hypothetical protein
VIGLSRIDKRLAGVRTESVVCPLPAGRDARLISRRGWLGQCAPAIQEREIDPKLQRSWIEIENRVAAAASLPPFDKEWGEVARDSKDRAGVVRRKKGLTINWRMARDHENGGNSRKYLKGVAKIDRYGDRCAVQSTFSGSSSDPVGAVDNAGFWAAKMGLRRCSWSRALTALSRSRNHVFSGQLQLPSTSV